MKKHRARRTALAQRLNIKILLLIACLAVTGGVYAVYQSLAATYSTGTVRIDAKNYNGGAPVSGVTVTISHVGGGFPGCGLYGDQNTQTSGTDGVLTFVGCPVSTQGQAYATYRIDSISKAGWYAANCCNGMVVGTEFAILAGDSSGYDAGDIVMVLPPAPPPPPPPPGPTPPPPPPPAKCADGVDNDGDKLVDYPKDPGCTSYSDADESNPALPPPPPPPPPGPTPPAPPPPPGPGPSASPTPRPSAKPVTKPSPPAISLPGVGSTDTTPPATPQNLEASQDSGVVTLKWDAIEDATTYSVERSTDEAEWTVLDQSVADNYDDSSVEYGTKYSYRVAAVDSAGNVSGYATTEITVDAFEANVFPDESTTLTSDDELIIYEIDAGTFSEPLACSITKGSAKPPKNTVIGPYKLVCKDKNGDEIEKYLKPIKVKFVLPKKQPAKNVTIARLDGTRTTTIASQLDEATNIRSISITNAQMLVAIRSGGSSWIWLVVGLLAAAIIAGFIILRRRQSNGGLDSPLASQYIPQAPATPSVSTTTPAEASAVGYQGKLTPHEENPLQSARDRLNQMNDEEQNPGLPSSNPTNHPQIHKYHDRPPEDPTPPQPPANPPIA